MTDVRFLGVATVEIVTSKGYHILVDPFLNDNPASPIRVQDLDRVDLLLVTHAAFDHFSDAPAVATRFDCPVVCGIEVQSLLEEMGIPSGHIISACWGLELAIAEVRVQVVESRHWSFATTKDGALISGPPLGFVVYPEPGLGIYISGDTALFSDLKLIGELYRPDIGLLNITIPGLSRVMPQSSRISRGMMSPYQAVLAAQWLGLRWAIPCHYIDPDCDELKQFVDIMDSMSTDGTLVAKPIILEPGETFTCRE